MELTSGEREAIYEAVVKLVTTEVPDEVYEACQQMATKQCLAPSGESL